MFFKKHIQKEVGGSLLDAKLIYPSKGIYQLQQDFHYSIRYRGISYEIIVPKYFYTNFATVPRFAWGVFHPTDPKLLVASCVHDYILFENSKLQLPTIQRKIIIDGKEFNIDDKINGFLAADLFFFTLSQEGAYNIIIRQFLRYCVKSYYFLTLKGWNINIER